METEAEPLDKKPGSGGPACLSGGGGEGARHEQLPREDPEGRKRTGLPSSSHPCYL